MRACDQELCAYWTGTDCCQSTDPAERWADTLMSTFGEIAEAMLRLPPFSWLERILAGPNK